METLLYYLCCECCRKSNLKKQTKTQKIKDLKTLDKIIPDSERTQIWSMTKTPLEVKTSEMTDIYRVPEQSNSEKDIFKTLGYKVESLIDHGSYGEVSSARHLQTGLKVAVKKISIPQPLTRRMAEERLALLVDVKNELYILQKLRHPHVIRMIQHFMIVVNKRQMALHIIMQLATGGTLSKMCESKGPFEEHKCKLWFAQMLSALSYIHREGIAHRDLKQSNVLLDSTEDCLISDFGLSRLVWRQSQNKVLESQTYCGTPPYIAPEILLLKKNSTDSYNAFLADVWALGVILFKMFDNTYPFSKKTPKALKVMYLKKLQFTRGRHPSTGLRKLLEDIFEPDPNKRPDMECLRNYIWIKDVYKTVEDNSQRKIKKYLLFPEDYL